MTPLLIEPHHPDAIDLLIDDVLLELANPGTRQELAERLQPAVFAAAPAAVVPPASPSSLLSFPSLGRIGAQPLSRPALALAALLNLAAALLLFIAVHAPRSTAIRTVAETTLVPPLSQPLVKLPPRSTLAGGGGGQHGRRPVTRGTPPPPAPVPQLNPPKAPPLAEPRLQLPVTVEVQTDLPLQQRAPSPLGLAAAPAAALPSFGDGTGTGFGGGAGAGVGSGSSGNVGGGIRRIGGGVSAPIVLYAPEPDFSEEARRAKVSGNVLVYLQVDTEGRPTHLRILRGIGLGLDEKALAAVRQYRFKPALENGHPVPVEMNVEVNFQIF